MAENPSVTYAQENAVALLTLNRPEARNALNMDTLQRLSRYLEAIGEDRAVRAVIITGAGPAAFCAGADIRFLSQATPLEVRAFARLAVAVNQRIEGLGKVVVAALNGHALGGGLELAESCTLRVAVRGARLGHPEVRIGAVAGFGGTTRLPRLVGRGRAAQMLLSGRAVDADEALAIGLVQAVAAPEHLLATTRELLDEILAQSPTAVRLTWEALHRGLNLSLEESALLGADYFALAAASDDFREGTRAFLEKRGPVFGGG